jgi:hypothetical protein
MALLGKSGVDSETMTCLKPPNIDAPKTLTFDQLIQTALELELEINRLNKQSQNVKVQKALENASEHIPPIIEWLTTAKKDSK